MSRERLPLIGSQRSKTTGENTLKTHSPLPETDVFKMILEQDCFVSLCVLYFYFWCDHGEFPEIQHCQSSNFSLKCNTKQTFPNRCLTRTNYFSLCLRVFLLDSPLLSQLSLLSPPQPVATNAVGIRPPLPPLTLVQDLPPSSSSIPPWHPGQAGHSSKPPLPQSLYHLLHLLLPLLLDPRPPPPLFLAGGRNLRRIRVQVFTLGSDLWMGQPLRTTMVGFKDHFVFNCETLLK